MTFTETMIETTRQGMYTHLHVVTVVKMNSHHVENMVSKEGNKKGDDSQPDRAGTGGRDAEVEGEEGGEDGGQGGEVVSLLSCRGVHRVEH